MHFSNEIFHESDHNFSDSEKPRFNYRGFDLEFGLADLKVCKEKWVRTI